MTKRFKGVLEVDPERGVIYFHDEKGVTLLRICGLPRPIPVDWITKETPTLLDVSHMIAAGWKGRIR